MKTYCKSHPIITRAGFALVVLLLATASATQAADTVKGATLLMQHKQSPASPVAVSAESANNSMPCPKCRNVLVQAPDLNAKGGQALIASGTPTKTEARHLCDGCSTTLTTVGYGKKAQQVAQHTCTACGADTKSCCATLENGKPTPGM